jgi:hypothetical protein
MHGKVSDKIDVYAFGVVLLELISGRKPVSAGGPKGKESLVMWAGSVINGGKLMDLVDPSLPLADGDGGEVERMALAAALCIRRAHQHRPSMTNVTIHLHPPNEPGNHTTRRPSLKLTRRSPRCPERQVVKLLAGDADAVTWAKSRVGVPGGSDHQGQGGCVGVVASPDKNDIQSYINLALRDIIIDDDDDASSSSVGGDADFIGANMSLEEYLKGRWSRSSSFDT